MAGQVRTVTVPGMAQAQQQIDSAVSSGQSNLQTVDGERQALSSSAYKSQQASRLLDQAILDWEDQFTTVLKTLEDFGVQMRSGMQAYTSGDTSATDIASSLASQIGGAGLPGLG